MILNIHNFNGQSLITHQQVYSPGIIVFYAAKLRNEQQQT